MLARNKLFIFIISLSLVTQNLLAGSFKTGNPERKKSSTEAFTETVFKKFEKLQVLYTEEKYNEARVGINDLLKKNLNSYEVAQVQQFLGYIDSIDGKYVAAANRFQKAIDSDALPNQAHFGMMLQMAQMYSAGDEYKKALDILKVYYAGVDEIKDDTFALEANIHYQMGNYEKVIPAIKRAIELSDKPKEKWNYMLYGAYKLISKFREASKVMEAIIEINPNKKEYWNRLSEDYFHLKEDKKALAVIALAYDNGLLDTEKENLRLWQLYSYLQIPYSAGKVLEKGLNDGVIKPSFKRWDDLGKTWYSAREMDSALSAYGEASKLSSDGNIDLNRAYIYLDKEDWKKVVSTVGSALEKGGLSEYKEGSAWMLLGNAEAELNNVNKAIAAFNEAAKFKKSRAGAVQWRSHLQAQQKQRKERAEVEQANERERAANAVIEQ